jgi:small subunit ribosomal protein S6
MPVNTYEGMFLLDSTKVAVNWDESVQHVHDILRKHNAEIVVLDNQGTELPASRQWDERRLAYPVEGQKKGTYLLTYFKTEGANIKEIEADCRLSDLVLRDLILKVHPKLVDHLVNQAMTSTPGQDEDGPGEEEMDDRPRRRRRDQD